ncbi:hypothetical protein F4680DRAFT_444845 [Xylaria scruposa]|nr:hypothetical protein F4680DRAFT_444845 [Xylaria scruposa]
MVVILAAVSVALDGGGTTQGQGSSASGSSTVKSESSPAPAPPPPTTINIWVVPGTAGILFFSPSGIENIAKSHQQQVQIYR